MSNTSNDWPKTIWSRAWHAPNGQTGVSNISLPSTPRIRRFKTPNVKNKKDAKGWRAPSVQAGYTLDVSYTPAEYRTRMINNRSGLITSSRNTTNLTTDILYYKTVNQEIMGVPLRVPSVSTNVRNRALTQALAKANRNQMEIGVALAESRKTLSMVATRAWRIADALRLASRFRFSELYRKYGARAHRRVSGVWLEYSYGWAPLINDLNDALDLWNKGLDRRLIVTAKSLVRESLPQPSVSWITNYAADNTVVWEGEQSCFVRLDYEVDSSEIQHLKQLGLFNPAVVAWELIPFSFLVDYLIPIGTMLQAAGGTFGLTNLAQSRTDRVSHSFQCRQWETQGGTSGYYVTGKLPHVKSELKSFRRLVNFAVYPKLYMTNPFSTPNRVANVAALIVALSKG